MPRNQYEVVMKPSRKRPLPKKYLKHTDININRDYKFRVCLWVADTPQSNLNPTVNLTLSHNNDTIRLCFNSVIDLITAIEELRKFVGENTLTLKNKHTEARNEYYSFHKDNSYSTSNYDNTKYTVIQGENKCIYVNKNTGEIFEELKNEENK